MPTIRVRTALDTNSQNTTIFPLQGNQYEYLPFPARVEFALVGEAATSSNIDEIRATVYSGSDVLQQQGPITNKSDVTAGTRSAQYPYDFLLDDVAAAGERLSVQMDIKNVGTTGTVDTVVRITPL